MRRFPEPTVPSEAELLSFLKDLLGECFLGKLEDELEADAACQASCPQGRVRLRVNAHRKEGGIGIILRILPSEIPGFDAITLEPALQRLVDLPRGLILVTGPTGSGKTTTLASLLQAVNESKARHIYTIEDPIEYLYRPARCTVTQRELTTHTQSFARALKSAMRADPDVILVGEMRDLATIQLALTAAETGHLVLSTLHTCDSSQSVDRIIDVFPAAQQAMVRSQLANVLQAVVAQVLLPLESGEGRVAAREILLATPAVRNLIREGKTHQLFNTLCSSLNEGMCPLEHALARLVEEAKVEADTARELCNRESVFDTYLRSFV